MTSRESRVSDEIVNRLADAACMSSSLDSLRAGLRIALEDVWPEPLLNDAELAAVIVALRFTDSGESHDDVMSAIAKLEAEDNRRYDEREGHA